MASSVDRSSSSNAIVLTESDVPGASLLGQKPEELSNSELKFWLKCRGDPGKGLKSKAELVKRVRDYIKQAKTNGSWIQTHTKYTAAGKKSRTQVLILAKTVRNQYSFLALVGDIR